MRILHVLSCPAAGGAEIYVRDVAIALKKRGHHVTVAFLNHAKAVGRSANYEARFLATLVDAGVGVKFISRSEEKTGSLLVGTLRARSILTELKPDICHCHSYKTALIFGLWACPCLLTIHFTINKGQRKKIVPLALIDCLVERYVTVSFFARDNLAGYVRKPISTICNARDWVMAAPGSNRQACIEGSRLLRPVKLLAVGRISPEKNYQLLIESAAILAKRNVYFQLEIAGEGQQEQLSRLVRRVEILGLNSAVKFIGQIDDVRNFMEQADLLVMTSKSEGMPITLIEAQFVGLPSVVTDVGACREIIERCNSGYIVPPNDPHAFATALERLINDADERSRLSENAKKNAGYYRIDRAVDEHLCLYASLTRAPSEGRRYGV